MPSQLQQLSLQLDRRQAAAAHHQQHHRDNRHYHAQLHGRQRTSRQWNVFTPSGINTSQLEFRDQLKREKKPRTKSGHISTLDMHSNYCIPGTRQSYDGHYDDYMYVSGTLLQSGCWNYYDTLAHPTKQCKQCVRSSTHVESVACGRGQALAA